MKYKLVKGKRKAIALYWKHIGRSVHNNVVNYNDFFDEEAKESGTGKPSDIHAVIGKSIEYPYETFL